MLTLNEQTLLDVLLTLENPDTHQTQLIETLQDKKDTNLSEWDGEDIIPPEEVTFFKESWKKINTKLPKYLSTLDVDPVLFKLFTNTEYNKTGLYTFKTYLNQLSINDTSLKEYEKLSQSNELTLEIFKIKENIARELLYMCSRFNNLPTYLVIQEFTIFRGAILLTDAISKLMKKPANYLDGLLSMHIIGKIIKDFEDIPENFKLRKGTTFTLDFTLKFLEKNDDN